MEKNSEKDLGGWVDARMGAAVGAVEWEPELEQGLALLRRGQEAERNRARTKWWTVGVVLAAGLGVLFLPGTLVFAGKCADACRSVFSSAPSFVTPEKLLGAMAPDFAAVDSSGVALRLSALKGKVVVLNFWATWCAPCARETPWMVEFQRKFGAEGLQVVGVSLDDDGWAAVRPFIDKLGVNYRMVLGNGQITGLYGDPEALPVTMTIDRAGRIAGVHAGLIDHDGFEADIRALIASR